MKNPTATVISYILHPLLVPTYIIAFLLNMDIFLAFMIPFVVRIWLISLTFIMTFAMPAMMIFLMQRKGIITSLQMEIRAERFYPLLLTAIFWGLGYHLIGRTGLPIIYYRYLLGGIAAIVVAMVVNHFWKISLHMLGMGGLTGVFFCFAFKIGVDLFPLLACVILLSGFVGYARLKVNSHNPPQIYTGYIVGVISMILVYLIPFI
ncbi:MAG: hypothetical protein Q8908_10090 [Bacteroidota bacterium]|nr:hypothetical protein [Bacteroidota bacterium]